MLNKLLTLRKAALVAALLVNTQLLVAAKKPKEVRTEITISATPEKVWAILTNFNDYPNWNPFIKSIKGSLLKGKKITVHLTPPDAKGMTFKPKVLLIEPNKEFRWMGHLLIPGLFDGEHIFELKDNGNGSITFIQREQFGGILVPLLKKMLDNNTKNGFEQMNAKLKELAEK